MIRASDLPGPSKKQKQDPPKDLGKIESITLINFMCHDNFTFNFGSRMNFVIGQNGSGKSAILTGLILALGGKSKATGRFSNIKGFIKNGKPRAKIEVILFNTGEFAYKPDQYGDRICVIREFTVEGYNTYKLKSKSGKVMSTHKEELLNVLNAMDIQIENPIQILTQETSRNFLVSKHATGENLYEMYFKGTGLQKLEDAYHEAKVWKTEAFHALERKKQALPLIQEELKKLKKLLVCREKIEDYSNELFWAGVIAHEKKLEKKQIEFNKVEKEINIHKREIENCKVAIEAKEKELAEYAKQRDEINSQVSTERSKVQKIAEAKETCTLALRKYQGALDIHKKEEKKIVHEIESLKSRIRESQQKAQIDVIEEKRKRQAEIGQLQETNKKIAFELDNLKKQRRSQMENQAQLKQQLDNQVAEMNNLVYHKRKTEENINRAKMAMKNKVNIFGDYTSKVLQEIKSRKREFTNINKLPKGPIGMYLEVKDNNWIAAVEKCISPNLLCTYCVDNHQDDRLLKQILTKHCNGRKLPSTIVCPFSDAVYDVSEFKAQTPFPTVLDMLIIKDIQVENALIDHAKIETKILIDDTQTGQNFMLNNPGNSSAAYIMNCDQICLNPYRYYSEVNQNKNSLLSSMRQDAINDLVASFNKATIDLKAMEEEKLRLQNQVEAIPSEDRKLNHQIIRLSSMKKSNQERMEELECVEEPEDVNCLEEGLQGLEKDYESLSVEIDDCAREVSKYLAEYGKIEEALNEQRKLLCDKKEAYGELGVEIQNCTQSLEVLTTGIKKYTKEATNCESLLLTVQQELEECRNRTEAATRRALNTCPRIDTKREVEEIQRQLVETSKVVEESSQCNKDELLKKYKEKEKVIADAEVELKKRSNYITRIDGMLKTRLKHFKLISQNTQSIIIFTFQLTLSGNGYKGSCLFDVKNRTLKLEVSPKADQVARKNHSTLSGGERSYVTLSFLLALWESTPMPFRVLDEYDVFMDSNNRKLSVDLLICKAQQMVNSQFIFLSPLDLPALDWPKDCVRLHKMPAPKRKDKARPSSSQP